MKTNTHLIISRSVLPRMKNVLDKSCRENHNTHFTFNNFFFFENFAVYEIMLKNLVEFERPQMTIWHMGIACCIPKSTNTYSEYVIRFTFPLQHWLHERAPVLRHTYRTLSVFFGGLGGGQELASLWLARTLMCSAKTP